MTPPNPREAGSAPDRSAPRGTRNLRVVQNAGAHSSARAPERAAGNLPVQLSSFIGRGREVAEVKGLLGDNRLLTLTGPGGCGKTRLAMAVAFEVVSSFEDGVWWVELASISDPTLLAQEVTQALGMHEVPGRPLSEVLIENLEFKRMLLVLDNCEHLIEACAKLVDDLLRTCPTLRVLATSREALGLTGERAWLVPSLSLPDPDDLGPVEELGRYEAVRLFVERAEAVDSGFELTPQNASAVARVCRRLDGVPLAIELAAARVPLLSVEQIDVRLDDCIGLLRSGSRTALPRQRTLRAAVDWSYDLLSEEERGLFRRLSVFASSFALEDAEVVCAGEGIGRGEVLELLSGLMDKSLVLVAERGSEARYRLLEPVRQYAAEKLKESGEEVAIRKRHADFFLRLAQRAEPELEGAEQGTWLDRLERELGNLRAALTWSLEGEEADAQTGLRLAGSLWWFCYLRGHYREGREWLDKALAKSDGASPALRAKALTGAGVLAFLQCEYGRAEALLEESLTLYRNLEDKRGIASATQILGSIAREQCRYAQAEARHEQSLALWRELGDDRGAARSLNYLGFVAWLQEAYERAVGLCAEALATFRGFGDAEGIAWSLINLGVTAQYRGDLERATRLLEESLERSREAGYREGITWSLNQLGVVAYRRGDHDRATELLKESLAAHHDLGDRWRMTSVLEALAESACAQGSFERATRLFGAAEAHREAIGTPLPPCERADHDRGVATARAGMGEEAFAAAWAGGRAMTPERAVEYALGEMPELPPAEPTSLTAPGPAAEPKEPPAELRVLALGPARVERGENALTPSDWGYAKPKELLYYLLTHPPRSREQIGLALWPDVSPSRLRRTFHDALHRLRRALGSSEWVVREEGRYTVNRSLSYFFDVEAFESKLAEARRLEERAPAEAIECLGEAVELYRGDFLEDLLDSEWVLSKQEELRRAYEEALRNLGGLLFTESRFSEAAEVYRKLISHDRFSEAAHRHLMLCYVRLGERGRALGHYQGLAELLREELGAQPAPETAELYELLRRGEVL